MKFFAVFFAAIALASSAAAIRIQFKNNCSYTIWPAVGKAPYGQPDRSVAWGAVLNPGETKGVNVGDGEIGIRSWGRTGCNSSGANCQTGACNGGLVCTDAGITSRVLLGEYGNGFGGTRTAWDLSRVDASINIDTRLSSSDGQAVTCRKSSCPANQAYNNPNGHEADRNSPLGQTYTTTFCA